jgi:tRNA-specific 2-thiouridylase
VAAALLKTQGYQVEAAYMRCWSKGSYCTTEKDQADAARVAAILGVPFQVFDFEKEYKRSVIDYFFAEYEAGRTPNPDVVCNKEIKFGIFLEKALGLGFDYIATGHYARIQNSELRIKNGRNGKGYRLLTGIDKDKDQSYFLYLVGQEQLAHTLFPVGDLTKQQVRKLAKKFGLPTADKPDSTGICFVGPAQVRELLMQKIKFAHGDIVSVDGKLLGRHIGLPFYTIGQREGLGISAPVPYYVAGKNPEANILIVAPFGHQALFKSKFLTEAPHWVSGKEPKYPLRAQTKLRYRAENVPATVDKTNKDELEVTLNSPQRAITPGQSAVFYSGEEVLGGAVITKVID